MRFLTPDNEKKDRPKSILRWRDCFFSIFFCFWQPLRCFRNDHLTSTVFVRKPCGLSSIVPCDLSHSIIREKKYRNLFFTGKIAFFLKSFCFHHLCCEEMILYLPELLPNYPSEPHESSPEVSHNRFLKKNKPNFFLHMKDCLFSKICVSITS